ncbi:jg27543 [Pararge aegeria aegeria]|uniref:Jg27543 protein n=1 Tax=Pararge aegeria aegeria TaxID=348720 RepID=A0A8S4SJD3_9NEOP|nr:jg27543 [Pararge aegeria aegeria]
MRGLEGPLVKEESSVLARPSENGRQNIILTMPTCEEMEVESLVNTDSDTDRALEALVGPWSCPNVISEGEALDAHALRRRRVGRRQRICRSPASLGRRRVVTGSFWASYPSLHKPLYNLRGRFKLS